MVAFNMPGFQKWCMKIKYLTINTLVAFHLTAKYLIALLSDGNPDSHLRILQHFINTYQIRKIVNNFSTNIAFIKKYPCLQGFNYIEFSTSSSLST